MTIKFNFQKFAQNMQKVGQNFLGNALLLDSGRMSQCGGFGGGSIWGCAGGMMGCTPPINIFHPMYADNQYNPYLTQAGMVNAEMQAHQMFEQALAQQQQYDYKFPTPPQVEDTKLGEEFDTAMKGGNEFKFVNEAWEKANAKEEKTDEEKKQVNDAYNASAIASGKSYLSYLDKKHGNNDGAMTLDEYTDYLIETQAGKDATSEEKAEIREAAKNAFANLDLDENQKIGYEEMSSVIGYLDQLGGSERDGKVDSAAYNLFNETLMTENEAIKDELKNSRKNLFGK